MSDWRVIMTPQKATLDSMRTLSWFVSYRRLSAQFQFSLSADTLVYLSQWPIVYSLHYSGTKHALPDPPSPPPRNQQPQRSPDDNVAFAQTTTAFRNHRLLLPYLPCQCSGSMTFCIRIRISKSVPTGLWILLFSSVAFKMPTKKVFLLHILTV